MSCKKNAKTTPTDDATHGHIGIAVDESFQPLVQAELDVFHAIYTYAHIKPAYVSESEAYQSLIQDSVRLVFTTRTPNAQEQQYFDKIKLSPRIIAVATDAVALIVSPNSSDTLISTAQLKDVLEGSITNWSQLGSKTLKGNITLVLDKDASSNLHDLQSKLKVSKLGSTVYAAGSNEKVIEYVQSHENAIGVIGVNWISDADDPKMLSFLKAVNVMSVAQGIGPFVTNDYYLPFQAYVAQGNYPLSRTLYMVSREARPGLGTGFVAFVASERGQRIILKMGLVPKTMPLRMITIKK